MDGVHAEVRTCDTKLFLFFILISIRIACTYGRLKKTLNAHGFLHAQYSAYNNPNTTAAYTWSTMISLANILPIGKFETTVKALQMYRLAGVMTIDDAIQLGGAFVPRLRAPCPRNPVPDTVPTAVDMDEVPDPFPVNTKRTLAALTPDNRSAPDPADL